MAIAKAGGSVDFIGIVGPNGKWLIDELRSHSVGVDRMVTVEVRSLRSVVSTVVLKVKIECHNRESIDPSCRGWREFDW